MHVEPCQALPTRSHIGSSLITTNLEFPEIPRFFRFFQLTQSMWNVKRAVFIYLKMWKKAYFHCNYQN